MAWHCLHRQSTRGAMQNTKNTVDMWPFVIIDKVNPVTFWEFCVNIFIVNNTIIIIIIIIIIIKHITVLPGPLEELFICGGFRIKFSLSLPFIFTACLSLCVCVCVCRFMASFCLSKFRFLSELFLFSFLLPFFVPLTFKNRASYIKDGRTATLQMLHFIYIFFNSYKYWVF
jgi:hypothetical protein